MAGVAPLPLPPLPPPHNSPNFDDPFFDGEGRASAKCRTCGMVVTTNVIRKHSAVHKKKEWIAARRDPNANTASCREVVELKAQVASQKMKRENVKMELATMKKKLEKVTKERDMLKEKNRCVVCSQHPCTTAFTCGHRACDSCARRLQLCHTCRGDVTTKIRLF